MLDNNMIRILFISLTRTSIDAFDEIINNFKKRGYQIIPHAFVLKDAYPRVRKAAEDACIDYGWETSSLKSSDAYAEVYRLIISFIKDFSPDVLVTDNERPIAAFIINIFNENDIPVVYLGHGFQRGHPFIFNNFFLRQLKHIYDYLRFCILIFLFRSDPVKRNLLKLKNPVGLKGEYEMCCYAGKDKNILEKYGVNMKRIHLTGYPYFDKVVNSDKLSKFKTKRRNKKKILVVSTGWGNVKKEKKEAIKFYNLVIKMGEKLKGKYDVSLRQKPGENIRLFLPKDMLLRLEKAGVRMNNSGERSFNILNSFDLIIGDASMVMFEALILKIPVIIFQISKIGFYNNFINSIWRERIKAIIVSHIDEMMKNLDFSLSKNYLTHLLSNFKKCQSELFCKLDGKAGSRVADVIIKAISDSSAKK